MPALRPRRSSGQRDGLGIGLERSSNVRFPRSSLFAVGPLLAKKSAVPMNPITRPSTRPAVTSAANASRRDFLRMSATAAAGALLAPHALSAAGRNWDGQQPTRYPDPDIV